MNGYIDPNIFAYMCETQQLQILIHILLLFMYHKQICPQIVHIIYYI